MLYRQRLALSVEGELFRFSKMTNSLTGEKVLTDSPAVAALAYPGMLFFFYESSHIFRSTDHASIRAVALVAAVLSLSLAYGVSLLGFFAAYVLGARSNQSRHIGRVRLLAHLVVASPPLFTAIGVLCFLLHAPNADYIAWLVIWIPLVIFAVVNGHYTARSRTQETRVRVRMAHGISALAILLVFLVGHMINHIVAIWSLTSDKELMSALRQVYRAHWLEPAVVGLFVFQIVSGLILLGSRTTKKTDLFGVLQTSSGMYLAAFLVSHLTAVFVLGRLVLNVNTNDAWAAGLPAGMVADLWNTRLIPHYSLAAFLLIAHVGCGLRGILLGHEWSLTSANKIAVAITGTGAAFATVIILAMLGVHLAGA
jgi:hypothetical protein